MIRFLSLILFKLLISFSLYVFFLSKSILPNLSSRDLFLLIRFLIESKILLVLSRSFINFKLDDSLSEKFNNSKDVKASTLLTPDDTELSEIILNNPISEVVLTCVPPHSSTENLLSIVTTLTLSPYFSPNRAVAPIFFAFTIGTFSNISISIF